MVDERVPLNLQLPTHKPATSAVEGAATLVYAAQMYLHGSDFSSCCGKHKKKYPQLSFCHAGNAFALYNMNCVKMCLKKSQRKASPRCSSITLRYPPAEVAHWVYYTQYQHNTFTPAPYSRSAHLPPQSQNQRPIGTSPASKPIAHSCPTT